MARLKEIQYNILKEIVENELLSAYDIFKNLDSDYGNINRNSKVLIENGYIIEAERVKGKTNNEKILYGLTEKGMVRYLVDYILIKDLFMPRKSSSELIEHNNHISKVFKKYPDFFPSISKNIKLLLSMEFKTDGIVGFNVSIYAILKACSVYLTKFEERERKFSNEAQDLLNNFSQLEKELNLNFQKPNPLPLNEHFEREFLRYYILEPTINFTKILPANMIFSIRIAEIFDKSDELKEFILDYFIKEKLLYEDYSLFYSSLSQIETDVENHEIFNLLE